MRINTLIVDPAIVPHDFDALGNVRRVVFDPHSHRRVESLHLIRINDAPVQVGIAGWGDDCLRKLLDLGSYPIPMVFQSRQGVNVEAIASIMDRIENDDCGTRLALKWREVKLPGLLQPLDLPDGVSALHFGGLKISLPPSFYFTDNPNGTVGLIINKWFSEIGTTSGQWDSLTRCASEGRNFNGQAIIPGVALDGCPGDLRVRARFIRRGNHPSFTVQLLDASRAGVPIKIKCRGNRTNPFSVCRITDLMELYFPGIVQATHDYAPRVPISIERRWVTHVAILAGLGFSLWSWAQSDDKWALNRENLDLAYNIVSSFVPMGLGASLASGLAYDEVTSRYT